MLLVSRRLSDESLMVRRGVAGGWPDWWCVDLVLIPNPWKAAEESRAFLLELDAHVPLGLTS